MPKKLTFNEEKFRNNLITIRKKAGLTQGGLAEKIQPSKTPSYISNIENGHSSPSLDSMIDLANALGVSLDALCGNNSQLSYRDIARSLILLYFLDGVKIDCSKKVTSSEQDLDGKYIVTIQIESGDLRQFMRMFDSQVKDRTNPRKFIEWVDTTLDELNEKFPWEKKNSERWSLFVKKMKRTPIGESFSITETELQEKFFGGKYDAKLQTQDNKNGEGPL